VKYMILYTCQAYDYYYSNVFLRLKADYVINHKSITRRTKGRVNKMSFYGQETHKYGFAVVEKE
jgi:hypothetical protein